MKKYKFTVQFRLEKRKDTPKDKDGLMVNAQILADNFFISKASVDRAFVEKMQISCKRYINKKKILHAQTLISEGIPALKAAERCSYESYATFFRQYKMILGVSPIQDKVED